MGGTLATEETCKRQKQLKEHLHLKMCAIKHTGHKCMCESATQEQQCVKAAITGVRGVRGRRNEQMLFVYLFVSLVEWLSS